LTDVNVRTKEILVALSTQWS